MKTWELITAIDEITDVNSSRFDEKKDKVRRINLGKGAKIVFGFKLLENRSLRLVTDISGLPIILLAIRENELWNLIDNYENEDLYKKFPSYLHNLINTIKSEINLSPMPIDSQNKIRIEERIDRINKLLGVLNKVIQFGNKKVIKYMRNKILRLLKQTN